MSILNSMRAFRNWPAYYAARNGLLRREFVLVHRGGSRLSVRPGTDDLKVAKSNFITRHYFRPFVPLDGAGAVIDIGANIGAFTVQAARLARRVVAFEPEPRNCGQLRKNIALNGLGNVTVLEAAVSGRAGTATFTVRDDSTSDCALGGIPRPGGRDVTVVTTTIEEVMRTEGLPEVDFVKLDCEGAEHPILAGMSRETASRIRGIAMETHEGPRGEAIDLAARLEELGFEVLREKGYLYARRHRGKP